AQPAPAPAPAPKVASEPVKQEVTKAVALEKVMEVKAAEVCPPKINLHINFKFDSAEIEQESVGRVNKFADFLKCTPDYKAKIIGHTDSIGSEAYNQKLSQKRADAVRNMIIKDGVPSDKITTSAKGETEPIATNKTDEGRAENRRIEAELTKN
ncbi:MAG: OmpA family protein, partial [Candidatus Magasanikbacteria bacterium]|nr:OmpA family protein [Candidatus Magasanikbacteria bacterium]